MMQLVEEALIGALLNNTDLYYRAAPFVTWEHFGKAGHARIFVAIGALKERAVELLAQDDDLGCDLAQLAERWRVVGNRVEEYAKAVYDGYRRRQLVVLGRDIIEDAQTPDLDDPVALQIARARDRLNELTAPERHIGEYDAPTPARLHELKTMPYGDYLQTPEWAKSRWNALRRAHYRCQVCNDGGRLNVHHRTYERRGQESEADLIVLCETCHSLFHENGKLVRDDG